MKQSERNPVSPCYWWLSFADAEGFRGACLVLATDFMDAHRQTIRLGLNPGGEVQGIALDKAKEPKDLLPFVPDKLYSKADIDAIDKAVKW